MKHPALASRCCLTSDAAPCMIFQDAIVVIADRHTDPRLSPNRLAEQLFTSRRSLYRAFESHGSSVAEELGRARLRTAIDVMVSGPTRPLPEVAHLSGLSSLDALRRHVRKFFGCSPAELRKLLVSSGAGRVLDAMLAVAGERDVLKQVIFNALFNAHFVNVLRYVERRIDDPQIAQDITAGVFEALWKKLDPLHAQGLSCLYTSAAMLISSHYRRTGRRLTAQDALRRLVEEPIPRTDFDDRLAVASALEQLSDNERHVVELTYWQGLSPQDVGAVLGMKAGAVWTMLSRIRSRLRLEFEVDALADHRSSGVS